MADPVLVDLGPEKGNLKLRTRVFTVQPGGGKAFADDRTVNHWYENHSKEAVIIVVSDVVRE